MGSFKNIKIWGIGVGILLGLGAADLPAQINKTIKSTTKTVTSPLKETQKMTKEAVQPVKEVRTTTKAVTDAPKEVSREVKATEKAFDNAGKEVQRAKTDVDKAVDKVDGNKEAKPDSAKKADPNTSTTKGGGTVIIDERTSRDEVRDGGGYGDLQKNPGSNAGNGSSSSASASSAASAESQSGNMTASNEIDYDYRRVLLPPGKGKTNLKSVTKKTTNPSSAKQSESATTATAAPKVKPDYSSSPAREALESADFQMETLADLFQYAEWEGPNRDHTMRSIDYTLKQLKRDIDEIRYKDAERSVWNYEKQYREWRDAYVKQGGQ